MPDGIDYIIKNIRRQLQFELPKYLVNELNGQKRQSAGWVLDEIEDKLKSLEKICQKKS